MIARFISIFFALTLGFFSSVCVANETTYQPFGFQLTADGFTDEAGNQFQTEITVLEVDLTSPKASEQLLALSQYVSRTLEQNKKVPKYLYSSPLSESTKKALRVKPLISRAEEDELEQIVVGNLFSAEERTTIEITPNMLGISTDTKTAAKRKSTDRKPAGKEYTDAETALLESLDKLYEENNKTFRFRLVIARFIGNGAATAVSVFRGGADLLRSVFLGTVTGAMSGFVSLKSSFFKDYGKTNKHTSKVRNFLRAMVGMPKKNYELRKSTFWASQFKFYTQEITFAGVFTGLAEVLHALPPNSFMGLAAPLAQVADVAFTSSLFMLGQGTFENFKSEVVMSKILNFMKKGEIAAAMATRKAMDYAFTIGSYVSVTGMVLRMLGFDNASYVALGTLAAAGGVEILRYKVPKFDNFLSAVGNKFKSAVCKMKTKKEPPPIKESDLDNLGQTP